MTPFAYGWVLIAEGIASDSKNDRGGHTVGGIAGAKDTLTFLEWAKTFEWNYWRAVRANELPLRLALIVFDAAVNSGPKQAIVTLQRTVLAKQDGDFGPKTMHALETVQALHGDRAIEDAFLDWRELFYDQTVQLDPSQEPNLEGWKKRLTRLRHYLDYVSAAA